MSKQLLIAYPMPAHDGIGQGPAARHVMEIRPFTFVAATTRRRMLSSPLRSRFGILLWLELIGTTSCRLRWSGRLRYLGRRLIGVARRRLRSGRSELRLLRIAYCGGFAGITRNCGGAGGLRRRRCWLCLEVDAHGFGCYGRLSRTTCGSKQE